MRAVLLTLIFFSTLAHGQNSDTIFNQTDNKGLKQGYWKGYYENKKLKYIGYFKDNKPVGVFKRYYDDGVSIKAKMTYDAKSTRVLTVLYYQNGIKAAEGNFIGTLKDSIWNYYSYYDTTLSNRENYVNGKKQGLSVNYYKSGRKSQELEYNNDIKNGKWLQFYDNNSLKLSTQFKDGLRTGPFSVYYPNGKPEWKGTYVNDKKNGKWTHYNPDGTLDLEIEYIDGVAKNAENLDLKESKTLELLEKLKGTIPEPAENNQVPGFGM